MTALYEIVPAGRPAGQVSEPLKYQPPPRRQRPNPEVSRELLTLKLRYKTPNATESKKVEFSVNDNEAAFAQASTDFKFASAVASFGMLLRDSEHKGNASFDSVLELARDGKGADEGGYRAEFLNLVERAKVLRGGSAAALLPKVIGQQPAGGPFE